MVSALGAVAGGLRGLGPASWAGRVLDAEHEPDLRKPGKCSCALHWGMEWSLLLSSHGWASGQEWSVSRTARVECRPNQVSPSSAGGAQGSAAPFLEGARPTLWPLKEQDGVAGRARSVSCSVPWHTGQPTCCPCRGGRGCAWLTCRLALH